MATHIDVIRQTIPEGLRSLSAAEQDQRMVVAILTTQDLIEKQRLIGIRSLLRKRAQTLPPPSILISSLTARALEFDNVVQGIKGNRQEKTISLSADHASVCEIQQKLSMQGNKINSSDHTLSKFSVPFAIDTLCVHWNNFHKGSTGLPHPYVKNKIKNIIPIYTDNVPNITELTVCVMQLIQVQHWYETSFAKVVLSKPFQHEQYKESPSVDIIRKNLFVKGAIDIGKSADWLTIAGIPTCSGCNATLLAFSEMRIISPILFKYGTSSLEFTTAITLWEQQRIYEQEKQKEISNRRKQILHARTLVSLLSVVDVQAHKELITHIYLKHISFPQSPDELQTFLSTKTGKKNDLWERLQHKDSEERDYWKAQSDNTCPHVQFCLAARKATQSFNVEKALINLVHMLEPEFKSQHDRWLRCNDCKMPAICPHALRELSLSSRGANDVTRRTALARYEQHKNVNSENEQHEDEYESRSLEHHCKICGEILFYEINASEDFNNFINRSTLPDEEKTVVRKELHLAANYIKNSSGNISLAQIVDSGEEPVGRLYLRALSIIRRDKVATPETLATRAACALGLYVYAFMAVLVISTPTLSFENNTSSHAHTHIDKVISFALRLFKARYAQQVVAVADSGLLLTTLQNNEKLRAMPSKDNANILKEQFMAAFVAIGEVSAPTPIINTVYELLTEIMRTIPFRLLAQAKIQFSSNIPKKFINALSTSSEESDKFIFEFVMGADINKFIPIKNRKPEILLWQGINIDWVPYTTEGNKFRYVWARASINLPDDLENISNELRHNKVANAKPKNSLHEKFSLITLWTTSRVQLLRKITMSDQPSYVMQGIAVYAGISVWPPPALQISHIPLAAATATFTPTGNSRDFTFVKYGNIVVDKKSSPNWNNLSLKDRKFGTLVDQTSTSLIQKINKKIVSDNENVDTLQAYFDRGKQRSFFMAYTTRCPSGDIHEWISSKCKLCNIDQIELYSATVNSIAGRELSKESLAYYNAHISKSGLFKQKTNSIDLFQKVMDNPVIPIMPSGKIKTGAPIALAQAVHCEPFKILMLGAYSGLTANELVDKKTLLVPTLYAAYAIYASIHIFAQRWQLLHTLKYLINPPTWAQVVLNECNMADDEDFVKQLHDLPILRLYVTTDANDTSPIYEFSRKWHGAVITYTNRPNKLYEWVLHMYSDLCIWALNCTNGSIKKTINIFIKNEVTEAIQRSRLMLHPTNVDMVRIYLARVGFNRGMPDIEYD